MTVTDTATLVEDLAATRQRTLDLVAHLPTADLERQIAPIMSPLVWDLGHIAAYEDLWLAHRHAGLDLLRPDLAALYDAFETPRAVRGDLEILGHADALEYLDAVRDRTLAAVERRGADPVLHEMVLRHELQHTETMRQAMAIAGLLPAGEPRLPGSGPARPADAWLSVPAGTHALGASDDRFAYDNERPLHAVDVPAFSIARRPVTNATWLRFVEGGGYVRREWWSAEGWAWKEEYDITRHEGVADGAADAPVCHVSWFEAEALARWRGARLPTEAEWEKAAGRLDGVGLVWEWTASTFGGYPGFRPHPYREYSEVFFGDRYRVLRGGSWATAPRVATTTFRNWDLPERRQIFAGVRLARDPLSPEEPS
ncbi:MAG TPA: SUMF1/EgtB/PvdO family nonheme iron enzyme [Baekduia sp.]|uniref:SUMF1/EgtB/PvdO family nonheme iron enzyme n=1 Tax=Baekduia sp. TaxID=2600305 RepID=UPI002C91C028|nr:SUMF1/EgtB/PvdO family nonheme iron enzyme [Baekduia sp.]HMJ37059.1 SUMF1/EgtB/PvdO family nonheme iron enzyme [Baekduia sp.]